MENIIGQQQATTRPRGRRSRTFWRETIAGYMFIMPWILGTILFVAGPMVFSLILSFMSYDFFVQPQFVGLENFTYMVEQDVFWISLYNTAYYVALGVPVQLIVGLILGLLVNMKVRGVAIWRTIYYLPSIVPAVASALLWMWIFNPDFGLLNAALDIVGIAPQRWLYDVNLAKPSFILMSLWGLGGAMIINLAGLQSVPDSLYEAASIDGANSVRKFLSITIPMVSPVIFFNLIMGIIFSFQIFSSAFIMTGGGPQNATLFYVLYLYRVAFQYLQMGYSAALAWVLFVIVLIFTLINFKVANRWVYYEAEVRS